MRIRDGSAGGNERPDTCSSAADLWLMPVARLSIRFFSRAQWRIADVELRLRGC
jgi:hypothetical protein